MRPFAAAIFLNFGDVEIHDGPAALEVQAERVNGRAEALLPDKLFPLAL